MKRLWLARFTEMDKNETPFRELPFWIPNQTGALAPTGYELAPCYYLITKFLGCSDDLLGKPRLIDIRNKFKKYTLFNEAWF